MVSWLFLIKNIEGASRIRLKRNELQPCRGTVPIFQDI
jgi:hypothetical protein